MKSTLRLSLAIGLACAALTACGGGGNDDPAPANFTSFVQGVVTTTSETAEPISLEGRDFTFSEDPAAFDALFQ